MEPTTDYWEWQRKQEEQVRNLPAWHPEAIEERPTGGPAPTNEEMAAFSAEKRAQEGLKN